MKKVGRFTWENGTVVGPKEYMEERGAELCREIEAGRNVVVNAAFTVAGVTNVIQAVLVAFQTDYAAWVGGRQLLNTLDYPYSIHRV